MTFAKTLTRNEMKNVMAGGSYLHCITPNGSESWYREDTTQDPDEVCQDIYPAYDSDDVSGSYGLEPIEVN